MFAVIDCGTTNTRIYILDDNENIIGQSSKKVGVRDTAISGSNKILKEGIKEAFLKALENAKVSLEQIKFAIASGMITSEIGLIEIPHLIAPIGTNDLAQNVKIVHDKEIFPLDIPIIFIRGIKNNYGENATLKDIRKIDFMRGEEVQVVGILSHLKSRIPLNIIILSSHTKLIHINQNEEIEGSITTISGQFFEALIKETFIGKCITENGEKEINNHYTFDEVVNIAYDSVRNSGLLRTMLMPRFMQVLLTTNCKERKIFVDTAIAAEDMEIFDEFYRLGYKTHSDYVIVGHKARCEIYESLIKNKYGTTCNITSIYDKEEIDLLTIKGAIEIAKSEIVTNKFRNLK